MSLWITTIRAQSEGDSSDTTKWRLKNLVENVKTKFEQDSQKLAKLEDENFRDMDDLPPISIYKDDYFNTGIPLNRGINGETADAKFQISLLIAGLVQKRITGTLEQFFAAIILSTLVLLSLISSKLAIYSLPVIPFVIYLSVLLLKKFNPQNRWIAITLAIPAFVLLLALPAVIYLGGTDEMSYIAIPLIYTAAGVLSVTGMLILYYLYGKRDTYRSIHTLAIGFLLAVFVAGWSMPKLNTQLGWGNMCEKAMELSEKRRIDNYWVYHISRAENMDVYLGKDITKVEREDILKQPHENRLLMLRVQDIKNDKELHNALMNKEQYRFGKYAIVIF